MLNFESKKSSRVRFLLSEVGHESSHEPNTFDKDMMKDFNLTFGKLVKTKS